MDISVVIPVYNSSESLEQLYSEIRSALESVQLEFEVVFVDDYSADKSWKVLENIKDQDSSRVKLIRFAKNYGQHSATFCGMNYTKGNYIVTIDDDLQNAPEDILKLYEKITSSEAELVYGIGEKSHSTPRRITSKMWKFTAQKLDSGLGEGSSFRIFKKELKDKLLNHHQSIIFIDELLYWYTNNIEFIKVEHRPRKSGKSGYSGLRLFRLIVTLSFNYGTFPLRMMTNVGVIMSIASFLLGLLFIIRKVFFSVNIQGFTALIVTILFSTSLIMISLGIIGKYLSNIFVAINNKPTYSISDRKL